METTEYFLTKKKVKDFDKQATVYGCVSHYK